MSNQRCQSSASQDSLKAIALAAMCMAQFMTNLDDTVVNMALPQIQESLNVNMAGLQWILNAYTLPIAALVLPCGTVGDIYGRKRVFLGGLVLFTLASVICGVAPDLATLIAGRAVQGVGAAVILPSSLAILADTFPNAQEKAKAIGIWSAVSGLALIAGPALGGLLVDTLGWQSVFFLNIPLGLITFRVTSRFVKSITQPAKQSLDLPGMLLSTILLASLAFALTEGTLGEWWSPRLVLLIIAPLSAIALIWVESRSRYPMLPLPLLKNPIFPVVSVVMVLVYFTLFSLLFIFSLFLQQVQGYSATAAGVRFLPMNGAFIVASLVSGWFTTRLGWRITIIIGLILVAVATLSFVQIGVDTEYGDFWGKLMFSGFGGGLTICSLVAVAMSAAPATKAGVASALLNTSTRIGGVLGIALQGTILTQRLTTQLERSLSKWNLPSRVQEQLIAEALRYEPITNLPTSLSPLAWQQAFGEAFVSGLHATVLLASFLLLVGAVLVFVFIPPSLKP